jgi:hypothetical protein
MKYFRVLIGFEYKWFSLSYIYLFLNPVKKESNLKERFNGKFSQVVFSQ